MVNILGNLELLKDPSLSISRPNRPSDFYVEEMSIKVWCDCNLCARGSFEGRFNLSVPQMHILILTCAYLKPNMPIKRLTCPRSRRSADHPLPSARPLPHLRQIALIQQIKSLYMAATTSLTPQCVLAQTTKTTLVSHTSCPAHLLVSPIILQVIAHYIPLAPNLVLRTMHCNAIEGSI